MKGGGDSVEVGIHGSAAISMNKVQDLEALPGDDAMLRAWSKVRSILHESGHRFNSRFAQQEYAGLKADPQETIDHFISNYDLAVAMAVKTVTGHESAVDCCTELDILLEKMLNVFSELILVQHPKASQKKLKALRSDLRRHLLPRSEHWKAEAHKFARKIQGEPGSSPSKMQTALGATQPPHSAKPDALGIMRAAMEQQGLNAPKLAVKTLQILSRRSNWRGKMDRSTIYRILEGKTKRPQPATTLALIEALQLTEGDAAIVHRSIGGGSSLHNLRKP
jgi:hypothetical protein